VTTCDINGGAIDGTPIGAGSATTGKFTTISASGQITSTISSASPPFVIASDAVVTNLNVSKFSGFTWNLNAGGGGSILYMTNGVNVAAIAAGTAGQFVASGGTGAPTWTGLANTKVFIGSASNLPAAQTVGGDATLAADGTLTIAAGAVTAAKCADALADAILSASLTAGSETGDTITCTLQVKDVQANNLTGVFWVPWNISDTENGTGDTARAVTTAYTYGAEWQQITANKKAMGFTDSTGKLVLAVTLTGDYSVYLMCGVGGKVSNVLLNFN
jgi:hypothetical protein